MCFLGVYTSLSFCTHALPFFLPDAQFTLRVPAVGRTRTGYGFTVPPTVRVYRVCLHTHDTRFGRTMYRTGTRGY
jgi:hypothetical protein